MVAVISPPRGSNDIWSYAMYGRMVAHYHENPYTHQPNEHPDDAIESRIPFGWQHVPSVYGPLFTVVSAGFAQTAGDSPGVNRALQQGLEAISVLLLCVWISRIKPDSLPFLLLGINPATIAIVNGGHNDLAMGALIAIGAHLAGKQQFKRAGLVLGCAFLVKATAIFGVFGVALWLFTRNKRRLVPLLAICAITISAGYAAVGGTSGIHAIANNATYTSRAALLAIPNHVLRAITGKDNAAHIANAVAVVIFLLLIWIWVIAKSRQHQSALDVAEASTNASIFASPYVLPWYSGWNLPIAAANEGTYPSAVTLMQSSALLAAYAVPAGADTGPVMSTISVLALPVCLLAAFLIRRNTD